MHEIDRALEIINLLQITDEGNWMEGYLKNAVKALYKELDYIKANLPKNSILLEYGSAPFIFTKALDLLNFNVIGTDICPERFYNFKKLDLDIRKVNYDLETLPVDTESIDEIICNEVFEHMRGNLIKTFSEAFRVLKVGGRMHLKTPNLRSIKGIYMFLVQNKSCSCACDIYHEWNKIDKIGHMGHVREYTSCEVIEFLENVGFKVERVIFSGRSDCGLKSMIFNIFELLVPNLRPSVKVVVKK
jgi:SAM-dependent methyltransferase